MRDKKILLELSEKISKNSSQDAITQVLNMICTIEEKNESKNELLELIFIAKNNSDILGGFNNAKYEINNLICNILCISKLNGKVVMNNKEFDDLSLEEFKYVLSWSRRIALNASDKPNNTKNNDNKNNYNKNFSRNKKSFNNENLPVNQPDEIWGPLKSLNFK